MVLLLLPPPVSDYVCEAKARQARRARVLLPLQPPLHLISILLLPPIILHTCMIKPRRAVVLPLLMLPHSWRWRWWRLSPWWWRLPPPLCRLQVAMH